MVSQLASGIFGRGTFYLVIQWSTFLILVLAANTAFQGFPRLTSILARDRFAPRQLANLGDRLVFSNGIVLLSVVAIVLIVVFHGDTHALIPLYALGVFSSFTLSQTGMGFRELRLKHPGWRLHSAISLFGATITCMVTVVIIISKFTQGAYITVALIVSLVFVFHKVHQHYTELGRQLRIERIEQPKPIRSTAIVLTAGIHKGIQLALEYARTLSPDCWALYVETDPTETPAIRDRWESCGLGIPLVIIESPYRSVIGPTLSYLEEAKKERPDHIVTVVLPEFVPRKWWHKLLHNQTGLVASAPGCPSGDLAITPRLVPPAIVDPLTPSLDRSTGISHSLLWHAY